MSEQNRRNNRPHKISAEVPEEMLRVPIPVIAPSLVWIGVIGNLQVALRQTTNYPLVPVLSRANVSRILGVISLQDIMETYRKSNQRGPAHEM